MVRRAERANWVSRFACPAASSSRSRRSTFPLNLVCHKVGPALAAGNAVIVKPASDTPLSALKLVEILLEAGLPPLAIACLTGSGGELGKLLCSDERVRKISFTGSVEVGKQICAVAGIKRVTMELGSNSPLIVLADADLNKVADAVLATGYGNAGQVCISTQRVIAVERIYGDLLDALKPRVDGLAAGDPLKAETKMGPMIRERDAVRVNEWIDEAVQQGAKLIAGGSRTGTLHQPTLLADVQPAMRVARDELFGPAVGVAKRRASTRRSLWPTTRATASPPASSRRTSTPRSSSPARSMPATCTSTGVPPGAPT